jgi:hypothetical protein
MPSLNTGDAIELAEMFQFLGGWMEDDHDTLAASLARFIGAPDFGPISLREDFAHFRFLLGATDGEGLFTPGACGRAGEAHRAGPVVLAALGLLLM